MGSAEMMITLVWLGSFAMVVLSIYFIMKYRSVTPARMIDVELSNRKKYDWQKPGIVVIGIGFGIMVSGIFREFNYFNNDAINVGIVAICAGISMVIANSLDKDKTKID